MASKNVLSRYRLPGLLALTILASFLADRSFAALMERIRTPALDVFFQFVSGSLVFIALGALLLWQLTSRAFSKAATTASAIAAAEIAAEILKLIFARPRPGGIELTVLGMPSYAFPSGHAALAFAPLLLLPKKILPYWIVLAAAIALGRVYLSFHSLSDVVAGAALGVFAGRVFAKAKQLRYLQKIAQTFLRWSG